jgi:hypothetical protein
MDTSNLVLLVLAAVFLGLYLLRRKSRVKRDDFD